MATEEERDDSRAYKTESTCLKLFDDGDGGRVELVTFKRDEDGSGDTDAAAAHILGIDGERVRCHSLPGAWDKKLNLAVHLYIDLEGVQHKLPHNTNASQFWLAAHLPGDATPEAISGPVLVTADDIKTEEFVDLTMEHWEKIKEMCKEACECAVFLA